MTGSAVRRSNAELTMERQFSVKFDKLQRPEVRKTLALGLRALPGNALAKCAEIDRTLMDFRNRLDRLEQSAAVAKAKAPRNAEEART
jgi:hypothetical protein